MDALNMYIRSCFRRIMQAILKH